MTETAAQDATPTESYGNFGLTIADWGALVSRAADSGAVGLPTRRAG